MNGVVYILTNPSFPEYVKIGYTTDLQKRLDALNSTECTPFAFRVYAVYGCAEVLQDKELHDMIDQLNPDLRSVDTVDGKSRVREFYRMSPETAFNILRTIASLSGSTDRLFLIEQDDFEESLKVKQSVMADPMLKGRKRRRKFSFEYAKIPYGSELVFTEDTSIRPFVIGKSSVYYDGCTYALAGLLEVLYSDLYRDGSEPKGRVTEYFMYNGETLYDRWVRMNADGTYGVTE